MGAFDTAAWRRSIPRVAFLNPRASREDRMRSLFLLSCAVAVAACAKTEKTPDTTTAAATPPAAPLPAPPPAAIKLSDVAGKWNVTGKNEAGDSTLVTYVFTAPTDTTGWPIKFPNRAKPGPVRVVSFAGDRIVIGAGPYPSVLRKGVQVRTVSTLRLQDGKLVGMSTARYNVKTADSVRKVRTEAIRVP